MRRGYSRVLSRLIYDLRTWPEHRIGAFVLDANGTVRFLLAGDTLFPIDVVESSRTVGGAEVIICRTHHGSCWEMRLNETDRRRIRYMLVAGVPLLDYVVVWAGKNTHDFYSARLEGDLDT